MTNIESELKIAQESLRQNSPKAVSRLEAVVAAAPDHPRARMYLGLALFKAGQADRAVAELERAAELAPQSAAAHYNLGAVRRQRGEMDAAREAFTTALRSACDHEPALTALLQAGPADAEADDPASDAAAFRVAEAALRLSGLAALEPDDGKRPPDLEGDIRWARDGLQEREEVLPAAQPIYLWRLREGEGSTAEDAAGGQGWRLHETKERELWLMDNFQFSAARRDTARVRVRSEGAERLDEQGYVLDHLPDTAAAAGDDGPRILSGLATLLLSVLFRSFGDLQPAHEPGQLAAAGALCIVLDRAPGTRTATAARDHLGPLVRLLAAAEPVATSRLLERLVGVGAAAADEFVRTLVEADTATMLPLAIAAMAGTGEVKDVAGLDELSPQEKLDYARRGARPGREPQVTRAMLRMVGRLDPELLAGQLDIFLLAANAEGDAGEAAERDIRNPMTALGYADAPRVDAEAFSSLTPSVLHQVLAPEANPEAAAWALWALKHHAADKPERLAPWPEVIGRLLTTVCRQGIRAVRGEGLVQQGIDVLLRCARAQPEQAKAILPHVLGALRDASAEGALATAEKSEALQAVWETGLAEPFADQIGRVLLQIMDPGGERYPTGYYDDDHCRVLLQALAPLRAPSAYELAHELEDKTKGLQGETAQFVRTLLPQDPGALTRALLEHGTPEACEMLQGSKASQRLIGLLQRSNNPAAQAEVATALGRIKEIEAGDALVDALESPNEDLRAAAARALADIEEYEGIPFLKKHTGFLRERSKKVREAAAEAISTLQTVKRKVELEEKREASGGGPTPEDQKGQ